MTDTTGLILVPELRKQSCNGCMFERDRNSGKDTCPRRVAESGNTAYCDRDDDGALLGVGSYMIWIENTDEAKATYVAARLSA